MVEEFQFHTSEFRKTMTTLNNQQATLREALMEELRLLRLARVPPNSTMNILDPDLLGTTKSTPTVLEFTMVVLAPVLHRDGLGKQVTSVTESASSLGVCLDTIQTTMTTVPPPFSFLAPLTTTSHFESVEIAPRSECSPDPSPEFGYSPTKASVHELSSTPATSSVANSIISTIEAPRPSRSTVTLVFTLVDSNGNSACQSTLNRFSCSHNFISKFRTSWCGYSSQKL
ncbi:hypothetical protein D8674_038673 [Pyrus ussuriensis x Pyrus communis]|uniref:Uncharacterized protein n=1 Tax=Pyrus ussuriensis x Pyrus communis TaxID=2448454 RepID=A0A5N5I8N9_9ROSA|nr:hypothetical protein D8674_038673 [Pyrus ussuriensis x Pyrus communis]